MAAHTRVLLSPLGIVSVLVRVEATEPPAHSASQASEWLRGVMYFTWPEVVEGLPRFQEGSIELQGQGFPRFLQTLELPSLTLWEHNALASRLTPAFSLLMLLWVATDLFSKAVPNDFSLQHLHPPPSLRLGPAFGLWALRARLEGNANTVAVPLAADGFWHCWGNVTAHWTCLWSAWKTHGEECYSLGFFSMKTEKFLPPYIMCYSCSKPCWAV